MSENLNQLYEILLGLYDDYGGAQSFLDELDKDIDEYANETGLSSEKTQKVKNTLRNLTETYIYNTEIYTNSNQKAVEI